MSYLVNIAGVDFPLPSQSERSWSVQVNAFFVAIGQSLLQKSGGSFTLTNDADFGPDKGALFAYIKTKTSTNIPASGWLRMDKADRIIWRNILNNADVPLGLSAASGRVQAGQLIAFDALSTGDIFTSYGRIPSVGETIQLQSYSGTGVTLGATYYVIAPVTGDTFKLSATNGGASIDVLTSGQGVMIIMEDVLTTGSTDTLRNKMARDWAFDTEAGTIVSGTINTTSGRVIQRITSISGGTDFSQINLPTAGKMYVFVNDTGLTITIKHNTGTATRTIYTQSNADITWANYGALVVIYDAGLLAWVVVGGGGGAGGLQLAVRTSSFTAAAGFNYLTDTTSGAIAVTLPAGSTGASMRFVDALEKWNLNNLTITPASGQKIDTLANNEALVCDVLRGWVELNWDGARWAFSSLASTAIPDASATVPGIVSIGTQTFAGAKTFASVTTTGDLAAGGQMYSSLNAAGSSSTAKTISWADANVQSVTMTGNCTFTFTNPVAGAGYVLILTQDGTGSRTATWPASVKWPASTAPTLTTTINKADIISFLYDGTNYLGNSTLNYL